MRMRTFFSSLHFYFLFDVGTWVRLESIRVRKCMHVFRAIAHCQIVCSFCTCACMHIDIYFYSYSFSAFQLPFSFLVAARNTLFASVLMPTFSFIICILFDTLCGIVLHIMLLHSILFEYKNPFVLPILYNKPMQCATKKGDYSSETMSLKSNTPLHSSISRSRLHMFSEVLNNNIFRYNEIEYQQFDGDAKRETAQLSKQSE